LGLTLLVVPQDDGVEHHDWKCLDTSSYTDSTAMPESYMSAKTLNLLLGIQSVLDDLIGIQQLTNPSRQKYSHWNRNNDRIGCGQALTVSRPNEASSRQDKIVRLLYLIHHPTHKISRWEILDLDFSTHQINIGW
jgi:hypothetical protein